MGMQPEICQNGGYLLGVIKAHNMVKEKIKGEHQIKCLMFPGKSGFFILKFYFHYFSGIKFLGLKFK